MNSEMVGRTWAIVQVSLKQCSARYDCFGTTLPRGTSLSFFPPGMHRAPRSDEYVSCLVANRTFCGAKWPARARRFAAFVHRWVTITALSAQFVFERRQQ